METGRLGLSGLLVMRLVVWVKGGRRERVVTHRLVQEGMIVLEMERKWRLVRGLNAQV